MTTLYLPGGISASFQTPEDAVAFLRAYHSGAQPVTAPPPIQPVTVTSCGTDRSISALVRHHRLAANLTLADVSRATGMAIPSLSSLELGRYAPGPLELAALGACLGADFVAAARGGT